MSTTQDMDMKVGYGFASRRSVVHDDSESFIQALLVRHLFGN